MKVEENANIIALAKVIREDEEDAQQELEGINRERK